MATNLATIVVELQSKTASFQNQFSQATNTVKKKTTELTQATNTTAKGGKKTYKRVSGKHLSLLQLYKGH